MCASLLQRRCCQRDVRNPCLALPQRATYPLATMTDGSAMPSCLPPQLVVTWLPRRDVAAALRVSKNWSGAAEPIFQAMAGRHGLRRMGSALGSSFSWRATVRQYRSTLGVEVQGWDPSEDSMRLILAAYESLPMISELISGGADVNVVNYDGISVLHIVASRGNLDGLNSLIAAGADLNAQNRYGLGYPCGGTPLHCAANSPCASLARRYACARRLIEAGANARLLNGDEDAPHHVVRYRKREDGTEEVDPEGHRRFCELLKTAFRNQR